MSVLPEVVIPDVAITPVTPEIAIPEVPDQIDPGQLVMLALTAESIAKAVWKNGKGDFRLVFEVIGGLRVRDHDVNWDFDPETGAESRLILWAQFLATDSALVQVCVVPNGRMSASLRNQTLAELNKCGEWETIE